MNYSTLKKTVALSFASLMVVGIVNAQTDSTKTATATTTSTETTTPKVFGGLGQYKKFSIGVNVGATAPSVATGGSNDFTHNKIQLGYGISFREQLAHSFGLQLDFHGGKVEGDNTKAPGTSGAYTASSFQTKFWSGTLSGVVNVATIDFLRRKNSVNFFVTAGGGLAMYTPKVTYKNGTVVDWDGHAGNADGTGTSKFVKELIIPVGAGVKFRLSDVVALNLGYTETFVDGDNFDGLNRAYPTKDKYSYGYAGLEFTLGSKSKPSLEWVNPVALMYDELYDAALRQEVEALKGRVTNVENAVNDLKKDSDGDGVADQFDKCPGTAAGSVVDGSGCVIVFPKDTVAPAPTATAYSNIQFEFDSSVLRTSSYPVLDATSADLRSSGKSVEVDGYASSEGTAAHNLSLSKDRANSVKTYLVNSGVDAKKVKVKGYGETNPIADNSTEEGRVLNRRVQFKQK
ncbi:OmpA-OmpF porin, OOP family [Mucilaginibacter sp. OK268]|uniref:OmpA family protein n=1 Tax=Mucilaginibacter sp. OK268 TaxID=1881048 RepID=UPI000889CA03|nr:OmpA family protein [Mucilaginibacter sp. OK268]SDP94364.1 OmpA-OmpF porin, OOP family [Mucilaginibacter sp. OK268]